MKTKAKKRPKRFHTYYPWDEWLAFSAWHDLTLTRKAHFPQCKPRSFAVMLRMATLRRGVYRTIVVNCQSVTVGPRRKKLTRGRVRGKTY